MVICISFAPNKAAHAGFEWLPAPKMNPMGDAAKQQKPSQIQTHNNKNMSGAHSSGAYSEWNTINEPHMQQAPPVAQKKPMPPQSAQPEMRSYSSVRQTPQSHSQSFQIAHGFGSDVPLAFAITQIVPPNYTHAFGKGVNLGQLVSWNGGQPWNIVIEDMVRPHGLALIIKDNTAYISRSENVRMVPVTGGLGVDIHKRDNPQPIEAGSTNFGSQQFWQAHKGQNLRDILIRWTPKANVELSWEATEDYHLASNVLIKDTFDNALVQMFSENLSNARAPEISFVEPTRSGKTARLIVRDRNS